MLKSSGILLYDLVRVKGWIHLTIRLTCSLIHRSRSHGEAQIFKVYFQGAKGRAGLGKPLHFKGNRQVSLVLPPPQDTLPLPLGVSFERSASGPSNKSICEASSEGTRRQDQLWFPWLWRGGEYSSSQGKSKLHSRPVTTRKIRERAGSQTWALPSRRLACPPPSAPSPHPQPLPVRER